MEWLRRTLLKKGTKSLEVTILQSILTHKGYSIGVIDGDFGTLTYNGVLQFQRDNNLEVDGIVGNNTWSKLLV